jgi:hypothetical protein
VRASARVALPPKKEAPRSPVQGKRGTAVHFTTNSTNAYSRTSHQLQVLAARYGVVGAHAALIASLVWGMPHGR